MTALKTCHSLTIALLLSASTACTQDEPTPKVIHEATPNVAATPQPPKGPTLTMGVVPQQAASKLARLWTPILNQLSKDSGLSLRFETAPTIPEFERRCARGDYDVAYMNPYHYTVFSEAPGYRALARQRDTKIKGILVKKKGSSLTTLTDLNGATLAFPAPKAFAATLLTSAGLTAQHVTFSKRFVSSHDSVYRGVAKGLFPAGGGIIRTLNNLEPEIRAELEVLWTTPAYTPHAIATHPKVTDEQRARLLKALTALEGSEAGRSLLSAVKFKGIEAAQDKDWDDVRALKIKVE